MARLRLTSDDVKYLRELANVSAGRIYLSSQRRLERAGLITIHTGRYGEYVRATDAGLAVGTGEGADAAPVTTEAPRGQGGFHCPGADTGESGSASARKAMITAVRRVPMKQRR